MWAAQLWGVALNWHHQATNNHLQAAQPSPKPAPRPPAMGQALGCCRAPSGSHSDEAVKPRGDRAGARAKGAPVAAEAVAAAPAAPTAGSPRSTRRPSLSGYYSPAGYSTDGDDEWHDAVSDIGSGEQGGLHFRAQQSVGSWVGGACLCRRQLLLLLLSTSLRPVCFTNPLQRAWRRRWRSGRRSSSIMTPAWMQPFK